MRDALDAAWGDFPTNDVGFDWLRYTGPARPTAEWCDVVSKHSRITFIQETTSTRSQDGFGAGVSDCLSAETRAREVHPTVASLAVVVSDGDSADNWDASGYGKGWASVATLPFFPYGAVPICESFIRGAGDSPLNLRGTWVPETWGVGTLISQTVGASPVPDTDLNRVHAPYWVETPAPQPVPVPQEDDMNIVVGPLQGRIGNVAWLVAGELILDEWSDADGGAGLGGPKKMVAWNGQTGHHYDVKTLDAPQMDRLKNGKGLYH